MSDVRIERLSRFIFTAPSWQRSLALVLVLGLIIDGASIRLGQTIQYFGTFGYIVPALVAFLLTKPMVERLGRKMTWNRSGVLALTCTVFGVIMSLSPILLVVKGIFPILYAISLGLIFAVRLLVLVAIADYRISRMLAPALTQSLTATMTGTVFFGSTFLLFALMLHLLFGVCIMLFIWLVERPMKRNFHISALNFINAFIAHNTDGSKNLEKFFHEIGEEVYVPQASLFFRRNGKKDVIFTVPNFHPGPMGEIGGGNLPAVIHERLEGQVMVAHGCATHDFNLVSESEIEKIIKAVQKTQKDLSFSSGVSKSHRYRVGTVQVLAQVFNDTLLMVSTRAPQKTEDLDTSIGLSIMEAGRRLFRNVAFVDAHNCLIDVTDPVLPATYTAYEYTRVCERAAEACSMERLYDAAVGFSHQPVPFTRVQGFGDLGIQAMVIKAGGQHTAYVLFDGNNMLSGIRDRLRDHLLELVDECEILTTDSHSVNTVSGWNPVGLHVSFEEILPFAIRAVEAALEDCSPTQVAGSTAWCEGVVVFGSHRVSQLASTVNAMLVYIAPLGLAILIFAFILSFVAYLIVT